MCETSQKEENTIHSVPNVKNLRDCNFKFYSKSSKLSRNIKRLIIILEEVSG